MVVIDIEKTAEKIKALMEQRGLTENELADLIGTNSCTIRYWMKGKNKPSVACLLALSELFGLSMEDIVSFSKKENQNL